MAPFKARTIVVDGHMFLKEKDYKSKIYWKCRKFSKFGCRCRLLTTASRIVLKMHGQHNHPIDEAQLAEVMDDAGKLSTEMIIKNSKKIKLEPLDQQAEVEQMILENLPTNSTKPLSGIRSVINSHSGGLKLTIKRSSTNNPNSTTSSSSTTSLNSEKKFKLVPTGPLQLSSINQSVNESNIRKFTSWSILKKLKPSFQCNIKSFMVLQSETDVLILTRNDEVYSFGKNENGLLGIGHTKPVNEPAEICELWGKEVVQMAHGGFHVLALAKSGHIYCWGNNDDGQLGNGTNQARYKPKLLMDQKFTSIKCGDYHNLALTPTGEVYAWGYNDYGQIGIGNNDHQMVPQKVFELDRLTVTEIACGGHHSLALTSEGQVYAWGINYCGQLGIGNFEDQTLPVLVELPDSDSDCSSPIVIKQIAAGNWHTLLLSSEGVIWTFGGNKLGQHRTCIPLKVNVNVGLVRFHSISANHSLSVALSEEEPKGDGMCYVWGELMNVSEPVQIPHKTDLTSIDEAIGVYSTVRSTPHLISIGTFDYQNNANSRIRSSLTTKSNPISQLLAKRQQQQQQSSNNNLIIKSPPQQPQQPTSMNKFRTILPKPPQSMMVAAAAAPSSGLSSTSPVAAAVIAAANIESPSINNNNNNYLQVSQSTPPQSSSSSPSSTRSSLRPIRPNLQGLSSSSPVSSNNTGTQQPVKYLLIQPSSAATSNLNRQSLNGTPTTATTAANSSPSPSYPSRAKTSISSLFNKPERSDVMFLISNKTIFAHRWYLAISSPYFDRKLAKPSGEWCRLETIPITEYSFQVFYRYVRYLYTDIFNNSNNNNNSLVGGTVNNNNSNNPFDSNFINETADFLVLAIDFNENELSKRCVEQLSNSITIENCCQLYELASKRSKLVSFQQAVTRYIFAHYKNVCQTEGYKAMNSDHFKKLVLSLEELKRNKQSFQRNNNNSNNGR